MELDPHSFSVILHACTLTILVGGGITALWKGFSHLNKVEDKVSKEEFFNIKTNIKEELTSIKGDIKDSNSNIKSIVSTLSNKVDISSFEKDMQILKMEMATKAEINNLEKRMEQNHRELIALLKDETTILKRER